MWSIGKGFLDDQTVALIQLRVEYFLWFRGTYRVVALGARMQLPARTHRRVPSAISRLTLAHCALVPLEISRSTTLVWALSTVAGQEQKILRETRFIGEADRQT